MPLSPENARTMREKIAAVLEIDPARVVPEANFFRDLGGNFDHLRPLRLETEAAFGVEITPITDEVNAKTVSRNGRLTKKSLKEIGDYLGLTLGSGPERFTDLFTVGFLEAITAKAIEQRLDPAVPPPAPGVQFAPFSRGPEVRQIVGRVLNVPAEQLSAETDLGSTPAWVIAGIFSELNARWGISVDRGVEKVAAASRCDAKGNLTQAARKRLADLLPGVAFPTSTSVTRSFIDRLGILEALVERDAPATDPAGPHLPIFRLPAGFRWSVEGSRTLGDFQRSLGDRKARQVLAECCRIANLEGPPWHALVAQGIEAMLKFSETGQGKKELKELTRDLKGWEREGLPLLKALAAGLRVEIPPDLLIAAAHVLAVAENLDEARAIARVQAIASALSAERPSPAVEPAPRQGKRRSLLSRLPLRAQRDLKTILKRCGDRTLEEYIAWEWNLEQQPESAVRERLAKNANRGDLSVEQRLTGTRFSYVYGQLAELAVARRFCFEDPTQVLNGFWLAGRIGWMQQALTGRSFDDPLLEALTVGDWAVADRYVDTLPEWDPDGEADFDFRSDGVVAVLRRDDARLKTALDRDVHRLDSQWYKAMLDFFRGLQERDPEQTSAALGRFHEAMKQVREKIDIMFAICPMTHGFYRLAESVSPDFVAGFDVSRTFPWDAEVHECITAGQRPWQTLDLRAISDELHEAVTTLHRPAWWPSPP